MKKVILPILILLFSCNLFEFDSNSSDPMGALNLSFNRNLTGLSYYLELTHTSGETKAFSITETTYSITDLIIGEWDIVASVKNDQDTVLYSGSDNFTIGVGETTALTMDLIPVGTGSLEFNLDFGSLSPETVTITAFDQLDPTNFLTLSSLIYTDINGETTINIPSQDIAAGLYQIVVAVTKNSRVIGGLTELVTINASDSVTLNLTVPLSLENSVSNNSVYRLLITEDSDNKIGTWNELTYKLNENSFSLDKSDNLTSSTLDLNKSCTYYVYSESGSKKVKLSLIDGTYPGEIVFTFGSDSRGNFTFTQGGSVLKGDFAYYDTPLNSEMEYFLAENSQALLDINSAPYSGYFLHDLNVSNKSHNFYSQPELILGSSPNVSDLSMVNSVNIQELNSSNVTLTDTSDLTVPKRYRVDFTLNGRPAHITYNFYSKYKGVAEYSLPNELGNGDLTGLAPFNFLNYRSTAYSRFDSQKVYRRGWRYSEAFTFLNGDGVKEDIFNNLKSYLGDTGSNFSFEFKPGLNLGYKSISILDENGNTVFNDCDILGRVNDLILIKARYNPFSKSDKDLELGLAGTDLLSGESAILQYNIPTKRLELYTMDQIKLLDSREVEIVNISTSGIPKSVTYDNNTNIFISSKDNIHKFNILSSTVSAHSTVGDGDHLYYYKRTVGGAGDYLISSDEASSKINVLDVSDLSGSPVGTISTSGFKPVMSVVDETTNTLYTVSSDTYNKIAVYDLGTISAPASKYTNTKTSIYGSILNIQNKFFYSLGGTSLYTMEYQASPTPAFSTPVGLNSLDSDGIAMDHSDDYIAMVGSGSTDSSKGLVIFKDVSTGINSSSILSESSLWHDDGMAGTRLYKDVVIYSSSPTQKYAIVADGGGGVKVFSDITTSTPNLMWDIPINGYCNGVVVDSENIYIVNYTIPATTNKLFIIPHNL